MMKPYKYKSPCYYLFIKMNTLWPCPGRILNNAAPYTFAIGLQSCLVFPLFVPFNLLVFSAGNIKESCI